MRTSILLLGRYAFTETIFITDPSGIKSYDPTSPNSLVVTFLLTLVIALLFYNSVTLSSLVMSMNDDHAYIGIFIVLPLCDGWGEPPFPRLICLIPEPAPTAYMFVYLF